WYVGFDPHTESISKLDLWIRIHKLPSEYANFEALSAILELNKFHNIWFDNFPAGCGACGELGHEFDSCSDRVSTPPKLNITLTKTSSKTQPSSSATDSTLFGGEWMKVGNKNRDQRKSHLNPQGHKPYLAENGGITIT
ncbi:hypothetical protein V2J09_017868, partial [Rumex salicifolius]